MFEFKVLSRAKNSKARTGEFITPHGKLRTPELAIVATEGEVKCIPREILTELPIQYLIVNTFHIYTKKILTKVKRVGGIHKYVNYPRVTASDSGGFQVFSLGFGKAHQLGKIGFFPGEQGEVGDKENPVTITDRGVAFPFDGRRITLNPEKSMKIQHEIGADIIFAFDECTSPLNTYEYNKQSLERTHRWLSECINHHKNYTNTQALFGIVQGAFFKDLRHEAAKFLSRQDVPGYGIGGSMGKTREDMHEVLDWIMPHLPDEKPRHLLGIGQVRHIFESVERGVDLFDCVIPTREARHKVIYTFEGKMVARKMRSRNEVLEKSCGCLACREKVTYQQLAELFTLKDPRAYLFATVHNIQFFGTLMARIRHSIAKNSFSELQTEMFRYY